MTKLKEFTQQSIFSPESADPAYDAVATVLEDGKKYFYEIDKGEFESFIIWACMAFESDMEEKAADYAVLKNVYSESEISIILSEVAQ